MSIPVVITPAERRKLRRMLMKEKEVVALNQRAYVIMALVALEMLHEGKDIAKVTRGYDVTAA